MLLVYFLCDRNNNCIKIGYTKRDIVTRKNELSTGNPNKIFIIGFVQAGTRSLELELHKKFKYARVSGEWFKINEPLLSYINSKSDIMAEVENIDGKLYVYKKMKC